MDFYTKIGIIQKHIDYISTLDNTFSYLDEVLGPMEDSKLFDDVWKMVDFQTDLISSMIDDNWGWLCWFIWDNECGEKAFLAGPTGEEIPIREIEDLLWAIEQ